MAITISISIMVMSGVFFDYKQDTDIWYAILIAHITPQMQ